MTEFVNSGVRRDFTNDYTRLTDRSVLPVSNITTKFPGERGNLAYNLNDGLIYYSNFLEWIPLFGGAGGLTLLNEGPGARVYDDVISTNTTKVFRSLVAGSGVTIVENPDSITISSGGNDISFFVDKSGGQVIPSTDSFTFTPITGWFQGGIGRYNTGQLNEPTGEFTAPVTGKYHFDLAVRVDGAPVDQAACLRLEVSGNTITEPHYTTIAASPDAGLPLQTSTDVLLTQGQIIRPSIALVKVPPSGSMTVQPFLGQTVFSGHIIVEIPTQINVKKTT